MRVKSVKTLAVSLCLIVFLYLLFVPIVHARTTYPSPAYFRDYCHARYVFCPTIPVLNDSMSILYYLSNGNIGVVVYPVGFADPIEFAICLPQSLLTSPCLFE